MNPSKCVLTSLFIIVFSFIALAQEQDSLTKNKNDVFIPRKNVVRFNPTPNMLGFQSVIFGYERVVSPNQSFSVNAGFLAFKPSTKAQARRDSANANLMLDETNNNKGFSFFADYRFYLKKENKFPAQRGIYVGPYLGAYYFDSETTIRNTDPSAVNATVGINTKFLVLNIGAELGYQFVIKNRITIDLILAGPSLSRYRLKMQAAGNLDVQDPEVEEALEELKDILVNQFEWIKPLFDGDEVNVKGTTSIWRPGMRYLIQIGYRF